MIQEHRMQCLTHVVVAAERERQVAHSAAYVCSTQVFLYPTTGADEINAICRMLLDTRCHGKDIRIENYLIRLKARLLCQQFKGTATDLNLALICRSLPLLIKGHNHNHSAQTACLDGTFKEQRLTLFQGD